MRKHLIQLLFSSFTTFLLLTAGFYFLILKPKIELPNALLQTETTLVKNYSNLVQNRLSIVGLASLDPTSPDLDKEKEALLQTAVQTNKTGIENFINESEIKKISDNEIASALPGLLTENKEVLNRQQELLTKLSLLAETNKNIFAYNPQLDLGQLHPIENKNEIIERSSAALLGLNKIRKNLDQNFSDNLAKKMSGLLTETGILFQDLIKAVENEDVETSGKLFDAISLKFNELKKTGLEMELSVIKSPEIVELLKDQTNLLFKYEYWMEKLNQAQEIISTQLD